VSGQGGRLLGIEASENAGAGLRVQTRYTIIRADARRNADSGIVLHGYRDDLSDCVANDNKGFGIILGGDNNKFDRVETTGNSRGDLGTIHRRDQS
jgi:parallel beta-helix repeat protein